MGHRRDLSAQVSLCAVLSTLPLLIMSQNYFMQRLGHVPMYNTVGGLPPLHTPLVFSSILPPYQLQLQPTHTPVAAYAPNHSTLVKETAFHGASNAVQKLILPIPNNHNLLSNIYRPAQNEPPTLTPEQTTHHPVPLSQQNETPLHILHPTIPVPKAFSGNPPKFIQVMQFPKVIRPFQALQEQLQQQALQQHLLLQQALHHQAFQQPMHIPVAVTTPMPVRTHQTQPNVAHLEPTPSTLATGFSNHQRDREPVFAGQAYSIASNDHKLVSPLPSNPSKSIRREDLAKIIQHVLEASKPASPAMAAEIVKSIEVFHHHENGTEPVNIRREDNIHLGVGAQHGPASLIQKQKPFYIDDVMSLGDNSVTGSNTVYSIANHTVTAPVPPSSNTEIELAELIDTFSISKLATNTSRKINEATVNVHANNKLTTFERNGEVGAIRPEAKSPGLGLTNFANAQSLANHLLDGSDSSSGSVSSEERGFHNSKQLSIGQQLKLRSYLLRDPAFNLIERYSKPAIPQTSTTVSSILDVITRNLATSQGTKADTRHSSERLPTRDSWVLVTPVYPHSIESIETTPTSTAPSTITLTEFTTPSTTTTTIEPTTTSTTTTTEFTTTASMWTTPSSTTTQETTTTTPTTTTTTPSTTTTSTTTEPTTTTTPSSTTAEPITIATTATEVPTTTAPTTTTTTTTPPPTTKTTMATTASITTTTTTPTTTTPTTTTQPPAVTTTEALPEFPYGDLAASETQNIRFEQVPFPNEQYMLSLLRESPTFRRATQQLLLSLQLQQSAAPASRRPSAQRYNTRPTSTSTAAPVNYDYSLEQLPEIPASSPRSYAISSTTLSSRAGTISTTSNSIDGDVPQRLFVYEKKIGTPKMKGAGHWARQVYNSIMSSIPTKDNYNRVLSSTESKNVTERVVNSKRMKKRRIRILLKRKNGEPRQRGFVRRIYLKVQKPE